MINAHNPEALDLFTSPDNRLEGFKKEIAMMAASMPDWRFEIDYQAATPEYVMAHGRFTGTHDGPIPPAHLMPEGIPPTGKKLNFKVAAVFFFDNGTFVKEKSLPDGLGMFLQLGCQLQLGTPEPE